MHEVPGGGVDADVLCTEGGDSRCGGVHAYEMHRHVAVQLESGGNRKCGGERAACAVDKHVNGFPGVFCEYVVYIIAVEVVASDEAFQMQVIFGLWHILIVVCHKSTAVNKAAKRH